MPQTTLSFRELIVSHPFDASSHFVDRERYRKFFSGLINDAGRIYREHLATFQEELDENLQPAFFEDIEPLDRPYFIESMQAQLEARLQVTKAEREAALLDAKTSRERLKESEASRARTEKKLKDTEIAIARKGKKKAQRLAQRPRRRGRK